MQAMHAIEAHDISVSIGRRRILEGVSIRAPAGAVTALIGPNGSGKTTLVKALCGDLASTGSIEINGRPLGRLKAWQAAQLRAVLPQSTTLAFPFTVREVVALGLVPGSAGHPHDNRRALPEMALERVDLDGYAGRFYQELSGGEQQRVQFARVLCQVWNPVAAGQPRYLVLDEPVSSLDIKHQLAIMRIARDFAERGGGVLAILHDLNLAAMFADQVVALHGGGVAAAGAPREVITEALLERVYDCRLNVGRLERDGALFVLPQPA